MEKYTFLHTLTVTRRGSQIDLFENKETHQLVIGKLFDTRDVATQEALLQKQAADSGFSPHFISLERIGSKYVVLMDYVDEAPQKKLTHLKREKLLDKLYIATGIWHNDNTPNNFLYGSVNGSENKWWIIDFGLANTL